MNIFLSLAIRNLERHWVRSLLSVTGIVIGVLAIASLGILGNSITVLMSGFITDVGDTLVVTPHLAASSGDPMDTRNQVSATISDKQVAQIIGVAGQNRVIPMISGADRMSTADKSSYVPIIALQGSDISYLLDLGDGVYPKVSGSGILMGSLLAEEFEVHTGSRITLGDEDVRISGVIAERGFGIDINPDYAIVTTQNLFEKRYGESGYSQVIVKVRDLDTLDDVEEAIERRLNVKKEEVDVLDSREILEIVYQTNDAIAFFLVGIGGVALLVAGVSILNVMIISVTERTREIGILRSIGTRRRDVLMMFLFEALILGAVGSAIGGALSTVGGYFISISVAETLFESYSVSADLPILDVDNIRIILYGMLFGTGTSIVAGLYPAWKATTLNPIEALRYE